MPKDYYVVLGVSRDADLGKIKKAYRTVVKQHHPDTAAEGQSPEKFLEAREAYETLTDESRRREYDRQLERTAPRQRTDLSHAGTAAADSSMRYNTMDAYRSAVDEYIGGLVPGFYPDFFEKGRGKGKELFLELILTPQEAARGGLFPLAVPVVEPCPRCRKTGLWEDVCCPRCSGYGRVRSKRQCSISMPPHVRHGTTVRLSMEDIGLRNVYVNATVLIDSANETM